MLGPAVSQLDLGANSLRVVSMSRTCGTFSRMTGSSVSRAAAMAGSAAFLAPLTRIVPSSGLPPRITNLSIRHHSNGDGGKECTEDRYSVGHGPRGLMWDVVCGRGRLARAGFRSAAVP